MAFTATMSFGYLDLLELGYGYCSRDLMQLRERIVSWPLSRKIVLAPHRSNAHYHVGDRTAEANAMVSLFESGYADQNDIAEAFGYSSRSIRRYQERFEAGGLGGG